jgi:excisionase family DNA binding protein
MSAYNEEIQAILSKPTCTVDELAKVLGIGRRQAYQAVKRGDIPSIRIGKRILISTREIQRTLGNVLEYAA